MRTWVLFDWGNTLMRVFAQSQGPMKDWPKVEVMPGARQALRALHGHLGVGLCTDAADSDEALVRAALGRVDLDSFVKRIFCARDLGLRKADPGYWTRILAELHVGADRVVMVGDDYANDIVPARAAGLRTVWFNPLSEETMAGEHLTTLHHLEALPAVLMGWGLLPRI